MINTQEFILKQDWKINVHIITFKKGTRQQRNVKQNGFRSNQIVCVHGCVRMSLYTGPGYYKTGKAGLLMKGLITKLN